MISLLIWLVVVILIFSVLWWALAQLPLPPPFPTVIRVVLALVLVVVLVEMLLPLAGGPPHPLWR